MPEKRQKETGMFRIYWMDNLRTAMIFLVVLLHAGLVYESSGIAAFFWIVDDPSTNDLSGVINIVLDIFVMPAIFLIAGFFAPLSLRRKGWLDFVKSKFKRLMLPWVIAVLTLIPIYKIIFLYSRNLPQESWTTYFHWSNGVWNQNWLWFLPVLFLFNLLYVFFSKLVKNEVSASTLKKSILAAMFIGLGYSLFMDYFSLQGWTKTFLFDFQNERILVYFMVFLIGSLCYQSKIFESDPKSRKAYIITACVAWVPVNFYLFLVIYSILFPGENIFSGIIDKVLIYFSYYLSLLSLLYVVVKSFRFYLDNNGKLVKALNRNSYSVYIIHVVVMGIVATALLDMAIPSIAKHVILAISTYLICNLIIDLARKSMMCFEKATTSSVNSKTGDDRGSDQNGNTQATEAVPQSAANRYRRDGQRGSRSQRRNTLFGRDSAEAVNIFCNLPACFFQEKVNKNMLQG